MALNTNSHSSISSNKDSACFLQDLLASKPILMQTINAICSDDDTDMENVVSGSGYTLTAHGLQAALKKKQFGSGFDIRMCGGMYEFTEPNDMKLHSLLTSTTDARVFINGARVQYRCMDKDKVVFTYDKHVYTVTFNDGYDFTADTKPLCFSGNRVRGKGSGSEETVSGKQVTPLATDLATLTSPLYVSSLALVCAVGGCTVMTLCACVWNYLNKTHPWRLDSVLRARAWARDILINARGKGGYKLVHSLDYQEMPSAVEETIYRAFKDYIRNKRVDPSKLTQDQLEEIRKKASEEGAKKFEQMVIEKVQEQCEARFRTYATFARQDDAVKLITEEAKQKSLEDLKDRVKGLDYTADYLKAVVDCARERSIKELAHASAAMYRTSSVEAERAAKELRAKEENKERVMDERARCLRQQGLTKEQIASDPEYEKLAAEIGQLAREATGQEQKSADNSKAADAEVERVHEAERKEREAEDKKNEKSGEIYGSHGA